MPVCGRVVFCGSDVATMARRGLKGNRRDRLFPRDLSRLLRGLCGALESGLKGLRNQLLRSDLILLSNSSNDVSPLIFSPLRKKVGVESTFNTSAAYF